MTEAAKQLGFIIDIKVLLFDDLTYPRLSQSGNTDKEERPERLAFINLVKFWKTYNGVELIRPGFEVIAVSKGPNSALAA
jgi:hypothetical protein